MNRLSIRVFCWFAIDATLFRRRRAFMNGAAYAVKEVGKNALESKKKKADDKRVRTVFSLLMDCFGAHA
jgi:hypothetical protein